MANITFSLDTKAAEIILTEMAAPIIKQSADAIANRASSILNENPKKSVEVSVDGEVTTNKRGRGLRYIAVVKAKSKDIVYHEKLLDGLIKAKDAGRL